MRAPAGRLLALPALVLAPLLAIAASACSDRPPPPTARAVVATTGMVADLAQTVLGDGSSVRSLMGAGVDPHLYKPTRDDVARIMAADLVVVNGLMLEGKMGEVLTRAGRDRWVIAVGDLLPRDRVIRPDGAHEHPDPHIWMDPLLWASAGEAFASAVAVRSPADAEALNARAAAYAAELRGVDAWARSVIETIPSSQRVLITSHDAFAYLGRAYGLRVEGVQGVSTDSEPGLRRIGDLVELIVTSRVPAVFVESSVPRKSIEALIEGARARGHTVVIGGELFSDAMGSPGSWEGTVPGMIDHNITTIVRALGGTAPERGWKGRLGGAADAEGNTAAGGTSPSSSAPTGAPPSPPSSAPTKDAR